MGMFWRRFQSLGNSTMAAFLGCLFGALLLSVLLMSLHPYPPAIASCRTGCEMADGASSGQAAGEDGLLATEGSMAEGASDAEPVRSEFALTVRPVEEISQYEEGLAAGCEPVSLVIALRSLGFDITSDELLGSYLPIDPTWTDVYAYTGSPYVSGQALPPAIVSAANAYFQAEKAHVRAKDVSGISFDELCAIAEGGSPVVLWTTLDFDAPAFSGTDVAGYPWYSNEHCVVLYGVEGDEVLVSDPIDGLIRVDIGRFGEVFEACGSYAVCFENEG